MTGITSFKRALRKSFSPAPIRQSISETTLLKERNTKEKVQEIATNQNMPSSATHSCMLIEQNKLQHPLSLIPENHAV
jgi:hypothetical protein